jgi:hypothetical protein
VNNSLQYTKNSLSGHEHVLFSICQRKYILMEFLKRLCVLFINYLTQQSENFILHEHLQVLTNGFAVDIEFVIRKTTIKCRIWRVEDICDRFNPSNEVCLLFPEIFKRCLVGGSHIVYFICIIFILSINILLMRILMI